MSSSRVCLHMSSSACACYYSGRRPAANRYADRVGLDDFEVSIFLTETSTRHSLLTKHKHFREKGKDGLKSNSDKLTGAEATSNEAIQVEDGDTDVGVPF